MVALVLELTLRRSINAIDDLGALHTRIYIY